MHAHIQNTHACVLSLTHTQSPASALPTDSQAVAITLQGNKAWGANVPESLVPGRLPEPSEASVVLGGVQRLGVHPKASPSLL